MDVGFRWSFALGSERINSDSSTQEKDLRHVRSGVLEQYLGLAKNVELTVVKTTLDSGSYLDALRKIFTDQVKVRRQSKSWEKPQ